LAEELHHRLARTLVALDRAGSGGIAATRNFIRACERLSKFLDVIVSLPEACGYSRRMGGNMTGDEFASLLGDFTLSAESGDGARFASHFTEDAVYHDYIYGPHQGRADIAHMMQNLFHRDATDYRWEMFDPVFDGRQGYAWSLSSFTSTIPQFRGQRVVIDGMSRFILRDGLIAEYRESVNGGVAMAQLGVEPARMEKVFQRWTGWLKERPETLDYLPRPKGSRAKRQ
jgi:ketosteroid isomerase-like protein